MLPFLGVEEPQVVRVRIEAKLVIVYKVETLFALQPLSFYHLCQYIFIMYKINVDNNTNDY